MPILPPTVGHTQRASAELHVEPDWIEFFEVAPGRVRIEVTVHNKGGAPSRPQQLKLHAAPIGAHLGWQPLAQLRLPAVLPRRTLTVATEVYRAQPSQSSLPLQVLRGAAHMARRLDRIPNLGLLWKRACNESVTTELWARSLPLDPFERLGRKSPNWAGGIRMGVGAGWLFEEIELMGRAVPARGRRMTQARRVRRAASRARRPRERARRAARGARTRASRFAATRCATATKTA